MCCNDPNLQHSSDLEQRKQGVQRVRRLQKAPLGCVV